MSKRRTFIFGYGSLVHKEHQNMYRLDKGAEFLFCTLGGYRRSWNIAVENRLSNWNGQHYVDRDGKAVQGYISYLNITMDSASSIEGALFEVKDSMMESIDRREKFYDKLEVREKLDVQVDGNVWTYIARNEYKEQYDKCLMDHSDHSVIIPKYYIDLVEEAYRFNGETSLDAFWASTDEVIIPVEDIRRTAP